MDDLMPRPDISICMQENPLILFGQTPGNFSESIQ